MSAFTDKLIVSLDPKGDGQYWYLEKEFEYYEILGNERELLDKQKLPREYLENINKQQSSTENNIIIRIVKVPKGFRTDFASIPKILFALPFINYKDKFNKAAVLHDFCYCSKLLNRKECDKLFLNAMKVLGIPLWKRYLFYYTVRIFGGSHYGNRSKKYNIEFCNKIDNPASVFIKYKTIKSNQK